MIGVYIKSLYYVFFYATIGTFKVTPLLVTYRFEYFLCTAGEKARCVLLTAETGLFPDAARPSHSRSVSIICKLLDDTSALLINANAV